MNAEQAFVIFCERVLPAAKAARLVALAGKTRGQRKILQHNIKELELSGRRVSAPRRDYKAIWNLPCFVFQESVGFGREMQSVGKAYDSLALLDDWVILLTDGSAGIFRPEAPRWDQERLIE